MSPLTPNPTSPVRDAPGLEIPEEAGTETRDALIGLGGHPETNIPNDGARHDCRFRADRNGRPIAGPAGGADLPA